MDFSYASEKFDQARRTLMLPHPEGEEKSLAHAFEVCSRGLEDIDVSKLDDHAARWVQQLESLMDTSGLDDPHNEGLLVVKARQLDTDDRMEVSRLVDELADWFRRREEDG